MSADIYRYDPEEPKVEGRLYRFPSGNIYRYDPDGDRLKPWCLQFIANSEHAPVERGGRIS